MTKLQIRIQSTIAEAKEERGAAMAEYGLLLALVALVAVFAMATLGETLVQVFGFAGDQFDGVGGDVLGDVNGGNLATDPVSS